MTNPASFRAILRSSSIIGGASVISILIGLVKFKVVALYLGPSGIGLIGLMLNIVSIAASVGGLGLAMAATRQVAAAVATGDDAVLATVRRAVMLAGLGLALLTGLAMMALRNPIAQLAGQEIMSPGNTMWLAVATGMTIAAAAQTALLNGLRRISNLAQITIFGAVVGTVVGLAAIIGLGYDGILAFVVATPLCTLVLGQIFVSRLPQSKPYRVSLNTLFLQWKTLAWIGFGLMATSLAGSGGQLFVRSFLQTHAGAADLGYFQAAWMISMNYLTFVLTAMAADFYPRLTAAINDRSAANQMVNEQTEIVLLLVGPLMIGVVAFAPLVINILYSSRFTPAVTILQLQTIGDILKVISWPLGIVILAAGKSIEVFLLELLAMVIFGGMTAVLFPIVGVQATGFAFIAMYLVYLPVTYWRASRITGLKFNQSVVVRGATLFVLLVLVAAVEWFDTYLGMGLGAVIALVVGFASLRKLAQMSDIPTPVLKLRVYLASRFPLINRARKTNSGERI